MYSGGTGTALDPYLVANATDLKDIESNMSAYFKQTQDITLGTFEPIGWNGGSAAATLFTGNYNGDNHYIKDGTISYPSIEKIGIFRSSTGTHSNIKLSNIQVVGTYCVGVLVGYSHGAPSFKMENVHTDSSCVVTGHGNYIGGLVGYYYSSQINASFLSITACSNKANVTGLALVGGICGCFNGTKLENCYNTGEIYSMNEKAGGIIGDFLGGWVNYCYNSGNISTLSYGGGIAGRHAGHLLNSCYALNDTITRTSGTATTFGRISGNSTSSNVNNNYALDTMQFIAL